MALNATSGVSVESTLRPREERIHAAFYRGANLTLENPNYLQAVGRLLDELLSEDTSSGDLTVAAMKLDSLRCIVEIRAKDSGIAAGIAEAAWLYERHHQSVARKLNDGHAIHPGDILMRIEGGSGNLLKLERVIVNLLQRMSGIATAAHRLVAATRARWPATHILGTRKTPWGLLDKRALHLGRAGTHRINLGDAILIKTNHLRLSQTRSGHSLGEVLRRAWANRGSAAFFEVEVTGIDEALDAARALADLQDERNACPAVLLLDNFSSADAARTIQALRAQKLHDSILAEASGGISESSINDFAAAGVDAISLGALTHSARALDLSAQLIPKAQ